MEKKCCDCFWFIERGCYDDDCCGLMPEQPTFGDSAVCPDFEPIEENCAFERENKNI